MIERPVLALVALFFAGCSASLLQPDSVARDDQQGQSGQGKDRFELLVPCPEGFGIPGEKCQLVVDLGRDKEHVHFERRPDGHITYTASNVTGAQQAATRAALERAIAEETNATAREGLQRVLDALPGLLP